MRKTRYALCAVFACLIAYTFVSCDKNTKTTYWENGNKKSVLHYKNGQLDGECLWFYASGKPEIKANYVDNVLEGPYFRWYENGNMEFECFYKNGLLDSVYHSYSLKGIIASEEHYVDGKLNGELKRWYENGQVFMEGQYVEDMMDGSWMMFYSDGSLSSTLNFQKGTGMQTGYDQSGYKCFTVSYVDNLKHGEEKYYNPDGRLIKTTIYEYGEPVSVEMNEQ